MNEQSRMVAISNDVIHFRPLARLRELARQLGVEVLLTYNQDTLPVKSIIAITAWELKRGDFVNITVRGPNDISTALDTVVEFIEGGCGDRE